MIRLIDLYHDLEEKLPKGQMVESLSIFPLPYKGYCEIFVETTAKKRYRALATLTNFESDFTEMAFPQQSPKVESKGVK